MVSIWWKRRELQTGTESVLGRALVGYDRRGQRIGSARPGFAQNATFLIELSLCLNQSLTLQSEYAGTVFLYICLSTS